MTKRVWLKDHAVVCVTGADRLTWLQGQVTQDLAGLEPGDACEACFVRPTGQIEAHSEVYVTEDAVFLVTDRPEVAMSRVDQFVILEDVNAEVVGRGVWRGVGPGLCPPQDAALLAMPEGDLADYNVATLETATPLAGFDYNEKTLLPELGPVFVDRTVSYTKGCYTGQEVLMRVHSRGHTNKTWVVLRAEGEVTAGDPVTWEGETVGKVTRSAKSPALGWLAAAVLPNSVLNAGTQVQIGDVSAYVP